MLAYLRSGRLSRPIEDYPPRAALVVLDWSKEALLYEQGRQRTDEDWLHQPDPPPALGGRKAPKPSKWGPPKPKTRGGWEVPRLTGDPVADEWERQIARGEVPNLER